MNALAMACKEGSKAGSSSVSKKHRTQQERGRDQRGAKFGQWSTPVEKPASPALGTPHPGGSPAPSSGAVVVAALALRLALLMSHLHLQLSIEDEL